MKLNKQTIVILAVLILGSLLFAQASMAQGLVPENCRRANAGGINCSLRDLIVLAANIVSYLLISAGGVALLFFFVGAVRTIAAGGNPEGIKAGKSAMFNALLGLVIAFTAYIIVSLAVRALTGGSVTDVGGLMDFWP